MKNFIFAAGLLSLFTGCANMKVVNTEVATGAVDPKAIYIRPFTVDSARYAAGKSYPNGEVGKSLAPAKFANILQEELSKIAPAMVLMDDEVPTIGWLVEGEFVCIDAGSRTTRAIPLFGTAGRMGHSTMVLHVRVTDMRSSVSATVDSKSGVAVSDGIARVDGRVIYEFDVAGGSNHSGRFGSVGAPGTGDAVSFDFHNAAERIMIALSPDPFRYGERSSPIARN